MWVALETRQEAAAFLKEAKPIQRNCEEKKIHKKKIYICLYPYLPSWVSLDYIQWQNKNGKLEKRVDSISVIQLAICCGIQGDSFSRTLA